MPPAPDSHPVSRFYVEIQGVTQAVFSEVSGLQIETEVFEYREGGNNSFIWRMPGPTRIGNLTLKHGLVASGDLFTWYMQTVRGTFEPRNVSVIIYNAAGSELARWSFSGAYPVRWVGPMLSAESSLAAVETIELAHSGLTE